MRVVCVLILLLAASASSQTSETVNATTLKNGMKVLVQEDHTIPSVALYLFFRVGSRDEHPGITGISHFFEHMMFNGSRKFGPGEFDRQMEMNGGYNNAYTTKDVTVYNDWFPPGILELMMDMESDRMAHMTFDPKIVESERGVVYSERRLSVDNSNFGALSEELEAAAIIAHPYHWPVIGWASDIEAWTLKDLEDYYKQGYAPNNCVMVAVGDTTAQQVFDLAHKYFENIPPHETFAEPRTKEPVQKGERVVRIQRESELPLLMLAFHMPETKSAETPAIEVLKTLLSTGDSSRLHAALVDREQAALTVTAQDEPSLNPHLLEIAVQPRAGVAVEKVRQIVLDELDKLQETPIAETELQKAKNQWLASHFREMKTGAGRANLLGTYELFYGDYKKLYEEPAEIEKVTAADIQRIAKNLFASNNRTVGILVPQSRTEASAKVTQ